jgi:hypothetical protein
LAAARRGARRNYLNFDHTFRWVLKWWSTINYPAR